MNAFAVVLAVAIATPVPSPSPSPSAAPTLKNIATVKSNPYCSSLATHFNGAAQPMIANDLTLDHVDTHLQTLQEIFAGPDYAQKYVQWRVKLGQYVEQMEKRLPGEQDQINQLRNGEKLTTNPDEAKSLHQAAEKMQQAYNHQMQLITDMLGVVQSSMDYDVLAGDHPLLGENNEELTKPADMKDIKSYLRFDGQRDVITQSENAAGDIALNIAETRCKP